MEMGAAVKKLIKNEAENGTIESMATAYSVALGVIPAGDNSQWGPINEMLPGKKLELIKTKAWRKYEAMVSA